LANNDGTLKKTNKAALARHIDKDATPTVKVELPSAAVIDGMALVQKIDGDNRTFAEVSEQIFKTALRMHSASQRMHAVCMYGFLRVQEAGLLVSIDFRTCWAKKCVHPW
jgi:hypothetical protein